MVAGLDTSFVGRIATTDDAGAEPTRIGYVFQEARLLPWRSVRENVRLAVMDDAERLAQVDRVLETVGLTQLQDAFPRQLSAGQARRAALARAFAARPTLLLMDEPFVSLDDPAAERLRSVLLEAWTLQPATVLFVSHDLDEAFALADRVVLLGGRPLEVLEDQRIELPRDARAGSAEVQELRRTFDARRREISPDSGAGDQR